MFGLGGFEIAIIAIFGFLIFGPDRLPQIARTIGRGIRQFRSAQDQMNKVIKAEVYDPIKDLEPLVNPFAGFSLDGSADDKNKAKTTTASGNTKAVAAKGTDAGAPATNATSAKEPAAGGAIRGQEKISKADMDAALTAVAGKAKAEAKKTSDTSGSGASAKDAATKAAAKSTTKAPSESFAQRRARLEQEHAKAKAAKATEATDPAATPAPAPTAPAKAKTQEAAANRTSSADTATEADTRKNPPVTQKYSKLRKGDKEGV